MPPYIKDQLQQRDYGIIHILPQAKFLQRPILIATIASSSIVMTVAVAVAVAAAHAIDRNDNI